MYDSLEDSRAYLQKRVTLFMRVTAIFFTGFLALDLNVSAEGEPIYSSTRVASLSVLVSSASVWAYVRRKQRSEVVCRALELTVIAIAMVALGALPVFPPVEGAGGVMFLFAPIMMAVVVLLRAALIPSKAWLSVLVGLIWGSVVIVFGIAGWEGITLDLPKQPEYEEWQFPFALGVTATLAISTVAGVISHVVHGLQTKVREAMELGQYTLESKIGEGGMGAVYRARHRMLRRPTAVKLLPPEKSGEKAIARFEREVQQTSRLTHPNTVAIFDFGRTQDGVFYYAMEYLDGISLQDLVERVGPLPPERVTHILAQVGGALSEAHGMGLVHRDIKPDNIMLCERGGLADVVKVLDFGLVKDFEAPSDAKLSGADTIQGTPLYMAPESLSDPDSVDARADIYAFGAVAYFLLTGKPVFTGKVVEVFGHHLHSTPEAPSKSSSSVEADLEGVVLRCLEKSPGERYRSAVELVDALHSCRIDGLWTVERAREWWDAEREGIELRRGEGVEVANSVVTTMAPWG